MSGLPQYFPVRPNPFSDEWFVAYVLRVADCNGRVDVADLCRTMSFEHRKNNYVLGHSRFIELIALLATFLRRDADELAEYFQFEADRVLHDEDRFVRDITVSTPKLCPICISQNGYFKAEWQLLHMTHCSKHSVQLLDHCSRCHAALGWNSKVFRECTSCDLKWEDVVPETSLVPAYQQTFVQQEHRGSHSMLRALYAVLVCTLRAKDRMFDSLQTLVLSNGVVHQHLLQAHALLTDRDYRLRWFKYDGSLNFAAFRRTPLQDYIEQESALYCEQAESETTLYVPIEKREIESVVRKPRLQLAESPLDLNFHVGLSEASIFLGLDGVELGHLIDMELILPLNNPRISRDMLFDLRKIDCLNSEILSKCHSVVDHEGSNLVAVGNLFKKLKYFGISKARLIGFLIGDSNLRLYSKANIGRWDNIFIDESFLFSELDKAFVSMLSDQLSSSTFRDICGLSAAQLSTLVSNTDLYYASWHNTDHIDRRILSDFFDSFLLLNRQSKIYEFDLRKAADELQKHGIEPVFEPGLSRPVFLYDKGALNGLELRDFPALAMMA